MWKKSKCSLIAIGLVFLLSACQEEETAVVAPFPTTFTLTEGVSLPTSPNTYQEILAMMTAMVEHGVMEMRVPYQHNLLDLDIYTSYEYAYSRAYQNVNATHIEYTSNTSSYHIGYSILADGSFFMTFSRTDKAFTLDEILHQNQVFEEEVDIAFQMLCDSGLYSDEMSEIDRVRVIFDYVLSELSYDFTFQPISFTAYGTVTSKKVVCQGYVALFNALLKVAGFQAEGIVGSSLEDGEGHIWSRVLVDGEWLVFDPTYADRPTWTPEEGDLPYNYTYFNLTPETILYDRTVTYYMVNNETLILPPL